MRAETDSASQPYFHWDEILSEESPKAWAWKERETGDEQSLDVCVFSNST